MVESGVSNQTLAAQSEHMEFKLQWVVLAVYPAATAAFWVLYAFCWGPLTQRVLSPRRAKLTTSSSLQSMCWRANCNSCLHTWLVVLLLVPVLASDDAMWEQRLHPHVNMVGHAAMSLSLVCTLEQYAATHSPLSILLSAW